MNVKIKISDGVKWFLGFTLMMTAIVFVSTVFVIQPLVVDMHDGFDRINRSMDRLDKSFGRLENTFREGFGRVHHEIGEINNSLDRIEQYLGLEEGE